MKANKNLAIWVTMLSFILSIVAVVAWDSSQEPEYEITRYDFQPYAFAPAPENQDDCVMTKTFNWNENGTLKSLTFDHMKITKDSMGKRWDFFDCEGRIRMFYYPTAGKKRKPTNFNS